MNNIRIAILSAGGLIALIGGAETASWGLDPLTAGMTTPAPQIVAAAANTPDVSFGADPATGAARDGPLILTSMPINYDRTAAPPAEAGQREGLYNGDDETDASAMTGSRPDATSDNGGDYERHSPDTSTAEDGTPANEAGGGGVTAGAENSGSVGVGPD